jgi:hypothetical protein
MHGVCHRRDRPDRCPGYVSLFCSRSKRRADELLLIVEAYMPYSTFVVDE